MMRFCIDVVDSCRALNIVLARSIPKILDQLCLDSPVKRDAAEGNEEDGKIVILSYRISVP